MDAPNSTFWLCEHDGRPVLAEDNRCGVMTSCAVSNEFSGAEDLCATDVANHISEPLANSTGVADSGAPNESSSSSPGTGKQNSRKRKGDKTKRKTSVRKKLRQAGQSYVDSKGKQQAGRQVNNRGHCNGECIFKCTDKINEERQRTIFERFWGLSDAEKSHFYGHTTTRTETERKRSSGHPVRPRQFAIRYYLDPGDGVLLRVCKAFYLGTLDISQRRISYFHATKLESGIPRESLKEKHRQVSQKSQQIQDTIRSHIQSIPRVASHYCHAQTNKEYMESGLNLRRLYGLYVKKCTQD